MARYDEKTLTVAPGGIASRAGKSTGAIAKKKPTNANKASGGVATGAVTGGLGKKASYHGTGSIKKANPSSGGKMMKKAAPLKKAVTGGTGSTKATRKKFDW